MARSGRSRMGAWSPRALTVGALLAVLPLAAWEPTSPAGRAALAHDEATAGQSHAGSGHAHGMAGPGHTMAGPASVARGVTDSPAAGLRVGLNTLLAEHVYLAARATGAAIGGQTAAFQAAAGALDANSVDLSKAIGAAYGADAEAAFLPLWRSHITMLADYAAGLAADDQAKADKAVNDLVGYTRDFGAFLSGANENLPPDVVAELVRDHVLTLKDVVDAQKARDQARVYDGLRVAIGHMGMIADPLAGATAKKFPEKFGGDPMSSGATLRVGLNNLLAEHVWLAASAALGGLTGNEAQFKAAAKSLDANSVDLARAIGAAYGPEAEAAFLPLWRSHIGMVVDYTVGKATDDQAKQDKAVADLVGYTRDFGAFLSAANENLPADVVAALVRDHVLTLKDVIDAQAAGDPAGHFAAIRTAGGHMGMIADPLAEATAAKFPGKFAATADGPASAILHFQMEEGQMQEGQMEEGMARDAEIRQFTFRPAALEVPAGTTVTWTNGDAIEHSVTDRGGAFDSGLFGQGGSFARTFAEPGEYGYFCTRHTSMRGTVTVTP